MTVATFTEERLRRDTSLRASWWYLALRGQCLVAVFLAAVCGCGRLDFSQSSSQDAADADGDSPPTRIATISAGSRLRPVTVGVGDYQTFVFWFDTELDTPCTFSRAIDGLKRCLPLELPIYAPNLGRATSTIAFRDNGCTERVIALSGAQRSAASCRPTARFALERTALGVRVSGVSSTPYSDRFYPGSPGQCFAGPLASFQAANEFLNQSPIDPSVFVQETTQDLSAFGSVRFVRQNASDGSSVILNELRTKDDKPCHLAIEGSLAYCLPVPAPPVGFRSPPVRSYIDANCSVLGTTQVSAEYIAVRTESDDFACDFQLQIYRVGSERGSQSYVRSGANCIVASSGPTANLERVELASFPSFGVQIPAGIDGISQPAVNAGNLALPLPLLWYVPGGHPCFPGDSRLKCIPPLNADIVQIQAFTDSACNQPAPLLLQSRCQKDVAGKGVATPDNSCGGPMFDVFGPREIGPGAEFYYKNAELECTPVDRSKTLSWGDTTVAPVTDTYPTVLLRQ